VADAAPGLVPPKAVPGSYEVRLTAGGTSETALFKLLPDPRTSVSTADYQEQFDLLSAIAAASARIQKATAAARTGTPTQEVAALVRELGVPGGGRGGRGSTPPLLSQLTTLYDFVAGSEDKPTASATSRWHELKAAIDDRLAKLQALVPGTRF